MRIGRKASILFFLGRYSCLREFGPRFLLSGLVGWWVAGFRCLLAWAGRQYGQAGALVVFVGKEYIFVPGFLHVMIIHAFVLWLILGTCALYIRGCW